MEMFFPGLWRLTSGDLGRQTFDKLRLLKTRNRVLFCRGKEILEFLPWCPLPAAKQVNATVKKECVAMKRYVLFFVLAALVVLVLVACGSPTGVPAESPSPVPTETAVSTAEITPDTPSCHVIGIAVTDHNVLVIQTTDGEYLFIIDGYQKVENYMDYNSGYPLEFSVYGVVEFISLSVPLQANVEWYPNEEGNPEPTDVVSIWNSSTGERVNTYHCEG